MTDSFRSDRFSALHDGEVSPAERDALRAELDVSPAASQEMSDYNQLSGLLSELPTEQLGDDFHAQVMRTIERRMLIPTARELGAGRHRSAVRKWWPVFGGIAASAAVLLAMLFFLDRRSPDEPQIAGTNAADRTETARPSLVPESPVATTHVGDASAPMKEGKDSPSIAAGTTKTFGVSPKDIAPKESKAPGQPTDEKRVDRSGQADLADGHHLEFSNLEKAEIGDVVAALDRTGKRVSVVRLTVVDRQQGLENLQVLLSKNSIRPIEGDGGNGVGKLESGIAFRYKSAEESKLPAATSDGNGVDKGTDFKKPAGEEPEEDLVCVYVKADSKLLSDALWQLRDDKKFKELDLETVPVEIAELDELVAGKETATNIDVDAPVVAPKPEAASDVNVAINGQLPHRGKQSAAGAIKKADAKQPEATVAQNSPTQPSTANAKVRARSLDDLQPQQRLVQLPSRIRGRSAEVAPNSSPNFGQQQNEIARNGSSQQIGTRQTQSKRQKAPAANSQAASDAAPPSGPVEVLLMVVGPGHPAASSEPVEKPAE